MRSQVIRMLTSLLLSWCGVHGVAWSADSPAPAAAPPPTPTIVATRAPQFRLLNLDGKPVTLADLKGRALLVVFWTTWADPCRELLPTLVELQKQYGGDTFTVLGLSLDEKGAKTVKEFATAQQLNFPILMANYDVIQGFGGLTEIPTLFLVEPDHTIRRRYAGTVAKRVLETDVKTLLQK